MHPERSFSTQFTKKRQQEPTAEIEGLNPQTSLRKIGRESYDVNRDHRPPDLAGDGHSRTHGDHARKRRRPRR